MSVYTINAKFHLIDKQTKTEVRLSFSLFVCLSLGVEVDTNNAETVHDKIFTCKISPLGALLSRGCDLSSNGNSTDGGYQQQPEIERRMSRDTRSCAPTLRRSEYRRSAMRGITSLVHNPAEAYRTQYEDVTPFSFSFHGAATQDENGVRTFCWLWDVIGKLHLKLGWDENDTCAMGVFVRFSLARVCHLRIMIFMMLSCTIYRV